MRINIFKFVTAAAIAFSVALSPVMATAAETSETKSSDPSGLGSAYSYQVPKGATGNCCTSYYDHDHANENATIVMKNFNQKLAAMQLAIIEALRLGTGQLSGNMREQTGAEHTLADQQDDRSTVKAVEEARLKALVDATSGTSSCYVITGATGGSLQGTVNKSSVAYSNELDKWVRGESTYSEKGQEAAEYYRLEAYCSTYGTDADVKAKLCKEKGELAGASVNASDSIFYKGSTGTSDTYDKERAEATNAFILNALAPNTYTPQTEAEAQSPEGRKKAARYKTQMARESVGRQLVVEFAKSRDPQSSGNTLASWAKGRVSKMQGMSGVNVDKLSYQQWMSIYAKGFLLDAEGLTASDQNPVTAIKDIKNMMAVLNYIAFEQLEQQQKINVQLAIQTAILNEQTRTDGIFGLASNK
ncbi:hypothetical protein OIU34_17995 [Pararhizobium sp. BT-229]|uniref:hypothetical protein n=1 Tax=Pararhizobium sp. BT-229 TaxID=2986923 RepID=UPI0021F8006A|nr:hypothetical protein [Pararhizobium sp. BT-229]MCV9963771.1 hypothetical protein [Pararhizobium sp. BT-229]